jgi:hypothetical protein
MTGSGHDCHDDVGLQADQLLRERSCPIDVTAGPTTINPRVAAIGPTQVRKRLRERRDDSLHLRVVFVAPHEYADAPHAVALLRARHTRPRSYRAAERDYKFSPSDMDCHAPLPRGVMERYHALAKKKQMLCAAKVWSRLSQLGQMQTNSRSKDL